MTNRHGLIAGATGTGKTRTLQLMAEQLSEAGVAVFAADVKGDLSGVSTPGDPDSPAGKRASELGLEFTPTGYPVEYLSLGGIGPGVPIRATVSDFGPQLLAKVLESNETQEQSLALFHYADQKGLRSGPSDLRVYPDLPRLGRRHELEHRRACVGPSASCSVRSSGSRTAAARAFGEPQFDVNDLLRTTPDGRG